MTPINSFLLSSGLRISNNPAISPDFCLDWAELQREMLRPGTRVTRWPKSEFATTDGKWSLWEDPVTGDCAWERRGAGQAVGLQEGVSAGSERMIYPATFANLLVLKNLIQQADPAATIFPTAGARLGQSTLGVGARFTTLHWPAVEWAMSALDMGFTANQNSIPRELVYDVEAMLAGTLDTVPFPFIGTNVPEGHQGQSVEGMSHGCVLAKLRHGFHRRGIAWSFNADHQPIGGKFDRREDALVAGCVLASYITFDLSPELAQTQIPGDPQAWVQANVPADLVAKVEAKLRAMNLPTTPADLARLLAYVWPGLKKMKQRDEKYRAIRERLFTTEVGRNYLRELSIDELPGLTPPETTAALLTVCEALGMKIHFVAPAFGFQKNMPYPDNAALEVLIQKQWDVCRQFGTSIGFHSGSGKSGDNYRVMGAVTGGKLEIKTSGRYTYEMGRALFASTDPADQTLWADWYRFTIELAVQGAFSADATEQKMARSFIVDALGKSGRGTDVFGSAGSVRTALEALPPSPEHMFWFEYNFLYVLAAKGAPEKRALGDHSVAGYQQRSRFYSISEQGRLNYAKNVAAYLVFLAETTGLVPAERCRAVSKLLEGYRSLDQMLADISR